MCACHVYVTRLAPSVLFTDLYNKMNSPSESNGRARTQCKTDDTKKFSDQIATTLMITQREKALPVSAVLFLVHPIWTRITMHWPRNCAYSMRTRDCPSAGGKYHAALPMSLRNCHAISAAPHDATYLKFASINVAGRTKLCDKLIKVTCPI